MHVVRPQTIRAKVHVAISISVEDKEMQCSSGAEFSLSRLQSRGDGRGSRALWNTGILLVAARFATTLVKKGGLAYDPTVK